MKKLLRKLFLYLFKEDFSKDESVGEGLERVNSSPEMCDLFG